MINTNYVNCHDRNKKVYRLIRPKYVENFIEVSVEECSMLSFFFFLEIREQCDWSDTTDDSDNLDWVKVLDRGVSFTAAWSSLLNSYVLWK